VDKHRIYLVTLPVAALFCMIAGIIVYAFNKKNVEDITLLTRHIEKSLESELQQIKREEKKVIKEFSQGLDTNPLLSLSYQPFFLYQNGELLYWSDNTMIPEYYEYQEIIDIGIIVRSTGSYLVVRSVLDPNHELFALITLYEDKGIKNDYLVSGLNSIVFPVTDGIKVLPPSFKGGEGIFLQENCLFKIVLERSLDNQNKFLAGGSLVFFFFSFILLISWLWYTLTLRIKKGAFESSLVIWILSLVLLRYLMLLFELPDSIMETGLFGSMHFASSRINPSLGDMLLNSIVILMMVYFIFTHYTTSRVTKYILGAPELTKNIVALLLMIFSFFCLWYPFVIIQTIYHNSQITFDITKTINYNYLRVVSFIIFIICSVTMFLAFHGTYRLLYQLKRKKFFEFFILTLLSAVLFSLYQIWTRQYFEIMVVIGIFYMNTVYHFKIFKNLLQFRYTSILYVFAVVTMVSVIGALAVYTFEVDRNIDHKIKFADHFLIRNDHITEYYLNETRSKIENDLFISSTMASPFLSKSVIVDKLRQVYLSSFFDKYDVEIKLYNSSKSVVYGNDREEYSDILNENRVATQYQTDYKGIYFLNRFEGEVVKRYIQKIEIKRRSVNAGYIIIDLKLKKIIPNDVYFELLMDSRFLQPYLGQEYSYAVYANKAVTYSSGDFNYRRNFPLKELQSGSELFKGGINSTGYSHIGLTDMEGRIIVVSSEEYSHWQLVTNFSYLFLLHVFFLLVLALFFLVYLWYKGVSLNFSARIQLYFNLSFFIPLVIVSFITLSLINSSSREEVSTEQALKAKSLREIFSLYVEDFLSGKMTSDDIRLQIRDIADIAGTDINLFAVNGRLFGSSKPLIYENNLLSRYLNPGAYARIMEQGENEFVLDEFVGELSYKSAYVVVQSFKTGSILGIISLPFFDSEVHLEKQQIEVLSTILNIFTIVFIAFILISYFVSKGLTFPLRLITLKLKKTTLTGFNEPVSWDSDDEIGLMVSEYNKMLENLESSKKALARSQKESAWREIAQQVAHEIKNPLTPMKLTLQHLQRKMTGTSDIEVQKPIQSLLHHIDTLDDIATSFSSLAKMPMPEITSFEWVSIIKESVNLHMNMEGVTISVSLATDELFVMGDQQLMGRILSNILINAAQSRLKDHDVHIDVILTKSKKKALLEIRDNGSGIDESIRSKIFVPKFTTKETGSGIGLAIAKHGIEHAGGKIWFESEVKEGTSFFIELQRT